MLVWLVKTGSVSTHWQSFWRGVISKIHEVYCLRVLLARSIRKYFIIIQSSDIILKNISKEYLDEFFISTTVLVLL